METTHQADQAKAAAERLLHTVNHLRRQLRRAPLPHETPANLRTGWAVDFALLRRQIKAEKAVLTPECLAALRPTGSYPVDAEYAAPTATAAALALACRVYRVLADTLDATGMMPPPDLAEAYHGEPERGLYEWLEGTDQAARYWQAVAEGVGRLETGRDLWPAIEQGGGECPTMPDDGQAGDDPPPARPEYLGDGRVRIGDETVSLEGNEADIVETLVARGAANIDDLRKVADNVPRVLNRIREKYPPLAPHIISPGAKGRGGYRTTIADGRRP